MNQTRGAAFLHQVLPRATADLPASPALLGALFARTGGDSSANLEDLASIIREDQALTAKILHLSNSAFYGLQGEVASIARAVSLLGLKEIRRVALAMTAVRLGAAAPLPSGFDLAGEWRHQLVCAAAARLLAGQADREDSAHISPEALFLAGMLHDVGKLLIAQRAPEDWRAIEALRASSPGRGLDWNAAELEHWGLDHGVIGGLALAAWNLPEAISQPVNWHHCPEMAPDAQAASAARLLRLADGLARRFLGEEKDAGELTHLVPPDLTPEPEEWLEDVLTELDRTMKSGDMPALQALLLGE